MPPSNNAIIAAWGALTAVGVRQPDGWNDPSDERRVALKRSAMAIWQTALDVLDDTGLALAVERWLRTREAPWWPMPAELLKVMAQDDADTAWNQLLELYRRHGRNNPPRSIDRKATPPARRIQNRNAKIAARFPDIAAKYKRPAEELDAPIADQGEPWFLDENPLRCRALEAGLGAAGGWEALDRVDDMTANRAAFRSAFNATYLQAISGGEKTLALEGRHQAPMLAQREDAYTRQITAELAERAMARTR